MARKTVIYLFLAALFVRILYSVAAPAIYSNVDTDGYYGVGQNIISHPSLKAIINPYRTPAYPVFLTSLTRIGGAQLVVIIQMIIGAIAFTVFIQVLSKFLGRRSLWIFSVFLLFDVLVIGWERTLLTQGLVISVSLVTTAILLQILIQPTRKKMLLFVLFALLGFLLRPQCLGLTLVSLPILAWYFRKNGRVVWWTSLAVAAVVSIPLLYARIDDINYHYFGLQFGGDIATLGRILELNIPIESAKNNTYFYTMVTNSRAGTNTTMPFRFLEQYDPAIYGKTDQLVQLASFNQTVISHTFPLFFIRAMGTIPETLLEVCTFTLVPPGNPLWIVQQAYGVIQYATLLVPFLWIVIGILWLVKPTRWNTFRILIGTIAISEIVLTAFTMYKDEGGQYARIISLVRPHLFLFLFLCTLSVKRRKI